MCKSKAQGGQRCFPHAVAAYKASAEGVMRAEERVTAANEAAQVARAQGGKAATLANRKAASARESLNKAKAREFHHQVALASTPKGKEALEKAANDAEAAGKAGVAERYRDVIQRGDAMNKDARRQYAEWSKTQPRGGSMRVQEENGRKVGVVTDKGGATPTQLDSQVTAGERMTRAVTTGTWSRSTTAQEDVAAYQKASEGYDAYDAEYGKVQEKMVAHMRQARLAEWRDTRPGSGGSAGSGFSVEVKGGRTYGDWDKDGVEGRLTTSLSQKHGMSEDETRSVVAGYHEYASVSGYRANELREHKIQPTEYATATPGRVEAVVHGRETPNATAGVTSRVLDSGDDSNKYAIASARKVAQDWDNMDYDQRARAYASLTETRDNMRATRDACETQAAQRIRSGEDGGGWTASQGRDYKSWHDKEGAHAAIREHVASQHAANGGDKAKAHAVLSDYAKAAQFNSPKLRPMRAAGMNPDNYSSDRTPRIRLAAPDQ